MRALLWLLACCMASAGFAGPDTPAADIPVVLQTDQGDVTLNVFASKAPKTAARFLAYVDSGFYDGTIFHRAIPNFIIQGGGFTAELVEKPVKETIPNESRNRLANKQWTVAMARTADPDSAGSQFFINLANNHELNFSYSKPGYTVFAEVIGGQDILEAASRVPRSTRGILDDVPETPLTVIKAYRQDIAP